MFVRVRVGGILLACWGSCFWPTAHLMAAVSLSALLCAATGCGDGSAKVPRKPVFPVSGEVFFNGAPAKHVMVVFHPADEKIRTEVWPLGYPKATVRDDGTFQIGTYEEQDGAPEGEYLILVVPTDGHLGEAQQVIGDSAPPPGTKKSGPGSRFASPENPATRITVEPKENKLPRIALTGGA